MLGFPTPVTAASEVTEAESKIVREVLAAMTVVQKQDEFDHLLEKHDLRKVLCAWVERFVRNSRRGTVNIAGPIPTAEIKARTTWWIRRVHTRTQNTPKVASDKLQLNLQPNGEGILECRGRIQGRYPIYLPDDSIFTEKLVRHAHLRTLHGGLGLTVAEVREKYWIPRLRKLTKKVVKSGYWGCKRFQAVAQTTPPPGLLPTERTEGSGAFGIIGVDLAGPIKYRQSSRVEGKAYLVLYACSLSSALHLEVLPNQGTTTFLRSFKHMVARRGTPAKVFSDNGKTFVGAARWLKQIQSDERVQCYLSDEDSLGVSI